MQPYVVSEVIDESGRRTYEPVVVRRVISEETSSTMVQMMNAVVDGVPTHGAQVPGLSVGGKTGTTTFENSSRTIASFAGFAPVEDPQFVMLITIDWPKTDSLGGAVAAPIFRDLAPKIIAYLGAQDGDIALVERAP
jgi:cell division protein FtsI/penicillin-binding protein 2